MVLTQSGPRLLRVPDYGDTVIGGTPWDRRFPGAIDEVAYYRVALPEAGVEPRQEKRV